VGKLEEAMRRVTLFALTALTAAVDGLTAGAGAGRDRPSKALASSSATTCAIENATFVVTGNRITQVGRAADVRVPAGATRVISPARP